MRAESAVMLGLAVVGVGSVGYATVWRIGHADAVGAASIPSTVASASATKTATPIPVVRGGAVTPRFAWPLGKIGRLVVRQSRERTGVPFAEAAASYEISVSDAGNGQRQIAYDHPKPVLSPGQPPPQPIDLLNPPLLIDAKGGLIGIFDEASHVRKLVDAVGSAPGAPPPAQLNELMTAVAQARAHNGWDSLVASWSGRKLSVNGETTTTITDLPPVPDAEPLRIATTIHTRGFHPCSDSDKENRCLKIESIGHPEGDSVDVLAKALGQQLGTQNMHMRFKSLEVRVSLLTEPSTLLPHRHELERRFTVELSQGSQSQEVTQIERQVQEFTYKD